MDCGPCDRRLCLDLRRVRCGHITCKRRTLRDFSPKRIKKKEMARLNREAPNAIIALPSPQCYQGPLYPWALHLQTLCHVAPHTSAHVDRSCGLLPRVSATCAPLGRPGTATWPQCRVAPWVGPARHVSRRLATSAPTGNKTPFFAILLIENTQKNK